MIRDFDELLGSAAKLRGRRALVVWPANTETLEAIRAAREELGLHFVLAGSRETIAPVFPPDDSLEIVDCPDVSHALDTSMRLLAQGEAGILMKGSVDTATLMKAALRQESGLRTGRLISDVFVFEYAARVGNRLVMITDGGVNIAPDLADKVELIHNSAEVAHALGNPNPKVAVLAATEFVQTSAPASIDAALLAKMNERGQIRGCVVDGPLALDNALDPASAAEKHIVSPVAGAAEILLCPTIECANALAKSTVYLAGSRLAHVIVGARVPILIPSRADKADAKLLSLALGMLMTAES